MLQSFSCQCWYYHDLFIVVKCNLIYCYWNANSALSTQAPYYYATIILLVATDAVITIIATTTLKLLNAAFIAAIEMQPLPHYQCSYFVSHVYCIYCKLDATLHRYRCGYQSRPTLKPLVLIWSFNPIILLPMLLLQWLCNCLMQFYRNKMPP